MAAFKTSTVFAQILRSTTNQAGVSCRGIFASLDVGSVSLFRSLVCAVVLLTAACEGRQTWTSDDTISNSSPPSPALIAQTEELGFEFIPFGSMPEEELEVLYQERLQICMQAHGFDYFPVGFWSTYPPVQVGTHVFSDGRRITHDEMAATFEFGIVEEMLIFVRDPEELQRKENLDPNMAYINSHSDLAQTRYWTAFDDDEIGCTSVVAASFGRSSATYDYDELVELAYEDPRITEFIESWSSCIQAKGYEFSDPGGPPDFFEEVTRRILDEANVRMQEDSNSQILTAQQNLIIALEALQRKEIEVALASESCGGTAFENQRLLDQVMLEIQTQVDEQGRECVDMMSRFSC